MGKDYAAFLKDKKLKQEQRGFKPLWLPDFLFDFQKHLVEWAVRQGRGALFEDCGLGKTPQALVWAENVVRRTNQPVLIAAPLAVSRQFVVEGEKFGVAVRRTQDGTVRKGVNVTNYERLHNYDPSQLGGVVADESSILKNFDGKTRRVVTDFVAAVPYCLLCTATPAPNDHMELGTSAEAVGVMGRSQMLGMFFTNGGESTQQWELKGHARTRFWEWVATWARAIRKPSDFGFDDGKFLLPELDVVRHYTAGKRSRGFLPWEAGTLNEQRAERKRTLRQRCEKVAELAPAGRPYLAWCHLNAEGDLLEEMLPGAVQVSGSLKDGEKEERLWAFTRGEIKTLVTKPSIAGFGLNWQHCSDMSFFPSHSHEQFYQALRRCYRFGQGRPVNCHLVASESEVRVVDNMLRKERASQQLYDGIIRSMRSVLEKRVEANGRIPAEVPSWLRK